MFSCTFLVTETKSKSAFELISKIKINMKHAVSLVCVITKVTIVLPALRGYNEYNIQKQRWKIIVFI